MNVTDQNKDGNVGFVRVHADRYSIPLIIER